MKQDNNPKQLKILSVEDDEFMSLFIKDIFSVHGSHYDFFSANNVEEAERKVEKIHPDLVILDVSLPEKPGDRSRPTGGFRLLEEIKSNPKMKGTKVIIFTGYRDKEIREQALKLGAEEVLIKGEYLPKELIEAVGKFCPEVV